MHDEFVMGNEAIALGALAAGVNVVCGYPGTKLKHCKFAMCSREPGAGKNRKGKYKA